MKLHHARDPFPALASSSGSIPPLLSLPREIRNLIFQELIFTIYEEQATKTERFRSARPLLHHLTGTSAATSPIHGILNTTLQLRREFTQELYLYAHGDHRWPSFNNVLRYHAPSWSLDALHPTPPAFARHLRSLSFAFCVATTASATELAPIIPGHSTVNVMAWACDWTKIHDDMDAATARMLEELPALEFLHISLEIGAGSLVSYKGEVSPRDLHKYCVPQRVMDLQIPVSFDDEDGEFSEKMCADSEGLAGMYGGEWKGKRKRKRKKCVFDGNKLSESGIIAPSREEKEAGVSERAATKPGYRLKLFKKSFVVQFNALPGLPFAYLRREDRMADGKRISETTETTHLSFISEWSVAPRVELECLFYATQEPDRNGRFNLPDDGDMLDVAYERWKAHGAITRRLARHIVSNKRKALIKAQEKLLAERAAATAAAEAAAAAAAGSAAQPS